LWQERSTASNLFDGEVFFASPEILPVADGVLIFEDDVWFALKKGTSKQLLLKMSASYIW
jgi:hypothetical protein